MANHVSHAALPYPIKGCRYTILVPYLDADGDPTDPTTPDTERSIDGAAFADCTEEVSTISGSNGMGYLTLTGDELNGSLIALAAKVASGPKATLAMLTPRVLPIIQSGTAQAGAAGTITLASGALAIDDIYNGCIVRTTGGTGGGGGSGSQGNQARIITDYVGSTKVATISPNWETNPDGTTTYEVLLTETSILRFGNVKQVNDTAQTAGDLAALINTVDDFLDTEIAAIKAKTDNLPTDPADASDIAASFTTVNTKLDTIDDFLDTEIAAIKAKTDNLPADPADESNLTALLNTIDDFLDTEIAAIKAKTDNLPADPADASDIAASFTTVNTKLDTIDDFLDTEIQTIITMLTGIVPVNGTIGATGNDTTHLHLSGLAYADDGPNGMLLLIKDVSAGIFVSRWIEDFANTGDLATVATLPFTPEASVDTYWLIPVRADVTGGSGLDAAGVRAAIGLASANLDAQLSTIDDFLDTEVAAIKAKTDNLPADPADASDIAASFTTVNGKLDTIDDFLDTEIGDIRSRLPAALVGGRMDSSVGAMAANTLTASALAADAVTEIAAGVGGAGGSGSISWVITVNDGVNPIEGVQVWVTTDAGGSNIVASGITNTSGQVTVYLDAGTYYAWKQKAHYTFINPQSFTVS